MCGIAGFIDPATSPADRAAAVERMCAAMRHRGPDDGGLEVQAEATLGMRRLAIFDPANGHQPQRTPGSTCSAARPLRNLTQTNPLSPARPRLPSGSSA